LTIGWRIGPEKQSLVKQSTSPSAQGKVLGGIAHTLAHDTRVICSWLRMRVCPPATITLNRSFGGTSSKDVNLGPRPPRGKAALSAKQGGGIAYRLGWVLYWACLVLAGMWAAFLIWLLMVESSTFDEVRQSPSLAVFATLPALLLYGVGRAFRYVLSGE
jgi:hypothetical protein